MLDLWFRPSMQLSLDLLRLAFEAQNLISLRLFRMATGGVPALPEALRMVPEKVSALAEAQALVATSAVEGRPQRAPKRVVNDYRRRVAANKRRLMKAR